MVSEKFFFASVSCQSQPTAIPNRAEYNKEKNVISLEPFDLQRFTLHFHKCSDVAEAQKPDFKTESQYFGVIQAFDLAHFIVRDPVE